MELYKGKTWEVVFVDWCQEFVGDCIISCSKESLSELTDGDWIELGKLEKELERISKKLFDATMFNFACLMNNAYRDNEKLFLRRSGSVNSFNGKFVLHTRSNDVETLLNDFKEVLEIWSYTAQKKKIEKPYVCLN